MHQHDTRSAKIMVPYNGSNTQHTKNDQLVLDSSLIPIGSMYAIYGNMDPINIPQSC